MHEIFVDKLYLQEGVSILPGDIVLDVGANIGVFTLFAAKQGAQVYAYEPVPPCPPQKIGSHDFGQSLKGFVA